MTTTQNDAPTAATVTEYAPEEPARLRWGTHSPEVFKTMIKLTAASAKGVDPVVLELVKIRASQLNQCAVCLDMHAKDALVAGETPERLVQLSAWRESRHFYTEKELAALELAEAVTDLRDGVPDEVFAKAAAHFEEVELSQLIASIAVINTWNRLNVTARVAPGHYTPGQYKGV
ncbi:carboxymuconolactone decarboxylase family protein [Streptomyces sp. NPDC005955]|uniref:carboxymuconolactone decarboxylase family protein n=1 Tax=Streptomyces sp. NPDC005955 TaxID=3364738 RepID=UPI0036C57DB8